MFSDAIYTCPVCNLPNPDCRSGCKAQEITDFVAIVASSYEPSELETSTVEYIQDVLNAARETGLL